MTSKNQQDFFLPFPLAQGRKIDLACLGRLAVDLYAKEIGADLEDASCFAKYLGGSSANIAFGAARLGMRSAMISRVGDEQMGRFLLKALQEVGCDVSMVQKDPSRLTALAILSIKDQKTFPLLFYRENCADMAIDPSLIPEEFIASCRALLITGSHLSTPAMLAVCQQTLTHAKKHKVLRVLDIDYRPVLWGLTKKGDGETRFIANDRVSEHIQQQLGSFDLLIGTEEEFLIAGGVPSDLQASLVKVRACTDAALVLKLGPKGCAFLPQAIPNNLDDLFLVPGEKVEVMNVLGAGDAFAAGLLTGFLEGDDFVTAAQQANACGALVVSRHGCAPEMPTKQELDYWFEHGSKTELALHSDPAVAHLHKRTVRRPVFDQDLYVLAFDHRKQFFELAAPYGKEALASIPTIKQAILQAVVEVEQNNRPNGHVGVLIDDRYGYEALLQATSKDWWIGRPVELPGSRPLAWDGYLSLASELHTWPKNHTIKCLVFYHPFDLPTLRLAQEEKVAELWEASRKSGHDLLLEIIPPAHPQLSQDEAIFLSLKRFYNLGIKPEWWKLPPLAEKTFAALAGLIEERDPSCFGITVLGLNQPFSELKEAFKTCRPKILRGFMVGRTIWGEPFQAWLERKYPIEKFQQAVATNYQALIQAWQSSR